MNSNEIKNVASENNIIKARNLLDPLRESMNNLFQEAANSLRSTEENPKDRNINFNKKLEEFFSILDQIEFNLQSGLKCIQSSRFSAQHLPINITCGENQGNSVNFNQFLDIVKTQIAHKNEIQKIMKNEGQSEGK